MIRSLLKFVLLLIVLVAVGAYVLGYWTVGRVRDGRPAEPAATGTTGRIDVEHARERGAEVGEKTAEVAGRAQEAMGDAALTAKIKSKMALDDTVQSRSISVRTDNGVVTLSGSVRSAAERQRALQLARETNGVKSVTDHLTVR